jgi:predicted membrane-bound spermidine synthase
MISLHRTQAVGSEVSISLRKQDGAVGYYKDGHLQTLVDAQGRTLSPFVEKAVTLLTQEAVRRILVLGHGGGSISSLLHKGRLDVVSVDCDSCAEGLGRLFFGAPASLPVVIEDAAAYVAKATPASFDAVLVDLQDSTVTPAPYLSARFWTDIVTALRPPAIIVTHVASALHLGPDWPTFRRILAGAGLDSVALSAPFPDGDRLLVSLRPK